MSTDDTATGLARAFFAERRHWIIRGSSTEPGKAVVVRLDDPDDATGPGAEHREDVDCAETYHRLVNRACGQAALRFLADRDPGQHWGSLIDEMIGAGARAAQLDDDGKNLGGEHKRSIDRVQAIRTRLLVRLSATSTTDLVES